MLPTAAIEGHRGCRKGHSSTFPNETRHHTHVLLRLNGPIFISDFSKMRQSQVLPFLAVGSILAVCVYFALRKKVPIASKTEDSEVNTLEKDESKGHNDKGKTQQHGVKNDLKEEEVQIGGNVEETYACQKNLEENKDPLPPLVHNHIPVLIAYGSQSGNATCIAQEVYEKLSDRGIQCNLSDLNSWKKWPTKLEDTKIAVFVVSTTGNGDAPDNCDKFQRYIKKRDIPETFLKNLSCCVLGLGDTNYDKFCEVAQWLQRRLSGLGATFLMKLACADDATGLEDVVEPWLEQVVQVIEDAVHGKLLADLTAPKEATTIIKSGDNGDECLGVIESHPGNFSVASVKPVSGASRQAVVDATDPISGEFNFTNPLATAGRAKTEASPSSSFSTGISPSSSSSLSKTLLDPVLERRSLLSFEASVGGDSIANEIIDAALNTVSSKFHKVVGMGLYSVEFCENRDATTVSEKVDDESEGFPLKVDHARYLTKGTKPADRRVIHAQFSGGPNYRVGDAIGLRCQNEEEDVRLVLSAVERAHQTAYFSADAIVQLKNTRSGQTTSLPPGCDTIGSIEGGASRRDSVQGLLRYGVDLSGPPKPQLCAALAQFCPSGSRDRGILLALSLKENKKNTTGDDRKKSSPFQVFVTAQELRTSELIAYFPSCAPPLSVLVALLPPLATRYYSISSSPLTSQPQQDIEPSSPSSELKKIDHSHSTTSPLSPPMTIAFSVVNTETEHERPIPRFGLCTNWLEQQFQDLFLNNSSKDLTLEAYLKPCSDFTLPSNTSNPVVMIGPGTGVAPFLGFIQHRKLQKLQSTKKGAEQSESSLVVSALATAFAVKLKSKADKTRKGKGKKKDKKNQAAAVKPKKLNPKHGCDFGEMTLYFGCRTHDDWLYRDEMEAALADGTLTTLRTAFSRMQAEKVYVQDLLRLDADKLLPLLLGNEAHFYVCGDGSRMARDVHAALVSILKTAKMSEDKAESLLLEMKGCGRYVQDIW